MIYLLELIQRRSTGNPWRLNCSIIGGRNIYWRRDCRRSYKGGYVLLQRYGANDDGDTDHQVKGWTRGLHSEVQSVLDVNDAAVS